MPFVILGAALLWFGWFGFNAGSALAANGVDGMLYGNPMQLLYQLIAVAVVGVYTFAGSYILLKLISMFKSMRVSKKEEEEGLDLSQHKEEAYG